MEGKNQTILVVLIAVVIVVAIFSSFGMNLFYNGEAVLTGAPHSEVASPPPEQGSELVGVSVTPQTVQSVIASLTRPEQYQRTVTVTYAGVDIPTVSQVLASGGWVRTDTAMPSGTVRHTLVGDGRIYVWYGSGRTWIQAPAEAGAEDWEGAGIPAYEGVLEVDPADITEAGYTEYNGMSCIYAAWSGQDGARCSCYVSVEANSMGLLVGAEVCRGETPVLSMEATQAQPPTASPDTFLLPDGTDPTQVQAGEADQG